MTAEVWQCLYCKAKTPVGCDICDKCVKEHTVTSQGVEITLVDVTYSRRFVERGPTGIILKMKGHLGRRALACEQMPKALQDQVREFVLSVELAHEPAEGGHQKEAA